MILSIFHLNSGIQDRGNHYMKLKQNSYQINFLKNHWYSKRSTHQTFWTAIDKFSPSFPMIQIINQMGSEPTNPLSKQPLNLTISQSNSWLDTCSKQQLISTIAWFISKVIIFVYIVCLWIKMNLPHLISLLFRLHLISPVN